MAIQNSPLAYIYASKELQEDRDIIETLFVYHPREAITLEALDQKYKEDPDLLILALEEDPTVANLIDIKKVKDERVLKLF